MRNAGPRCSRSASGTSTNGKDSAACPPCAALDSVPDPVSGLLIYHGRGGTAGTRTPRRPKPAPGAEAISLPEPQAVLQLDLTGTTQPDPLHPRTAGRRRTPAGHEKTVTTAPIGTSGHTVMARADRAPDRPV